MMGHQARAMAATGLVVLASACSGGDDDTTTTDAGATQSTQTVQVELKEWSVTPDPAVVRVSSIVDQAIEFVATNTGVENHELVIVRADSPDELPTNDEGKVLEDELPDGAFIGEIEEFAPGGTESASFELEPGTYVLFCNIVDTEDGETESHFQEGMATTFTVEG